MRRGPLHRCSAILAFLAALAAGCAPDGATPPVQEASARGELPAPGAAALEADLSAVAPSVRAVLEQARDAVRAAPEDPEPWQRLGLVLQANGLAPLAASAHEATVRLRPRRARAWYRLGLARADSGDDEGAAAAFERVLRHGRDYQPARWRLALADLELDRIDAALRAAEAAVELHPRDADGRLVLARVLLQAERAGEAFELLSALELPAGHPNAGYATLLLATAARATGQLDLAARLQEGLGEARPRWSDPWADEVREHRVPTGVGARLGLEGFEAGPEQRPLDVLEAARRAHPEDLVVLAELAEARARAGRTEEAIALLEELVRAQPGNRRAHHNLASLYASIDRLDEARAAIARALALAPERAQAHALAGELAERAGEPDAALASYRRACELDARPERWQAPLGLLLFHQGQLTEAAAHLSLAARAPRPSTEVLATLVRVQHATGQDDLARGGLERLARREGAPVELLSELAALLGEAPR